jgi:hypothetical protein
MNLLSPKSVLEASAILGYFCAASVASLLIATEAMIAEKLMNTQVVSSELINFYRLRLFASYDLDVTLRPDVFNGHVLNDPPSSTARKFDGVGI